MVAQYGEQFHHNNPSQLTDQLYLSAARAVSSSVLLNLGITCVINATLELPTVAYQKQECMQIAVEDTISSKLYVYFDLVADKINSVHRNGGKMIIYCRAGMSRSAALCIAYFMKYHGMSVDDAFQYVRERRPIIHPNTGFMRQLRDYEKKLRAKRSQPNIHQVGDPLIVGQPMPELVYGAEESETNSDGLTELTEIKPRPKPRIPKYKPTEIRLCCAEVLSIQTAIHEYPDPKDMPPQPPTKRARTRSKKFPYALPANVQTPAQVQIPMPTIPQCKASALPTVEGLSVAEVRSETPLIDPATFSASPSWSPSASFKKRNPFSKISEPAKIAVSSFNLILSNCSAFNSYLGGYENSNRGIVFTAEPHSELAQVLEEVTLECPISSLTETMMPESEIATTVLIISKIAIFSHHPQIYECPGVYQYQKMDNFTANCVVSSQNKSNVQQRQPPQRLQRNTATRMSLKIPGLNIRPAPEKHKKLPLYIEPDYFSVASCSLPPVYLERAEANIGRFRANASMSAASVILYAPDRMSCVISQTFCGEESTPYTKSSNLITLMTVPTRKLLMTSNCVAVSRVSPVLSSEKETPIFLLPSREYPYYARVPRAEQQNLERAKTSNSVEATWFFPLKAKPSTTSVCLTQSGKSLKNVIPQLPALQWAAERSEYDIDTQWREARPLQDEIYDWQKAKKVSNCVEKCAHQTSEVFKGFFVGHLSKYVAPEAYNSWSVMRMCVYPLFSIAQTDSATILNMNNIYCEPRPFSTRANSVRQSKGLSDGGYLAAERTDVNVCCDLVELVEIPDVVGDISQIKSKLVNQNDPVKLSIWLEVFKRSVLRARPVFPFVVLREVLPTPTVSKTEIIFENISAANLTDRKLSSSFPGDKSTTAVARPVLEYPVVVTLNGDGIDDDEIEYQETIYFSAKAFIPNKQRASEMRDYIHQYLQFYWIQPLESYNVASDEKSMISQLLCNARVVITAPLGGAVCTDSQSCYAETGDNISQSLKMVYRTPFSRITQMKPVAESDVRQLLVLENLLPGFQVVEERTEMSFHDPASMLNRLDNVAPPSDVMWYFMMENPHSSQNHHEIEPHEARGAVGGDTCLQYSLYLPDPDALDRLAVEPIQDAYQSIQEDVCKPDSSKPIVVLDSKTILPETSIETHDFVQGSVKTRRNVEKRVRIDNSPPTIQRINEYSPQPISRLGSSLISYQRPPETSVRPRSRSSRRNRTDSAATERRTMSDLEASVRHASDLLERRRLAKASTSSATSSSSTSTSYQSPSSSSYQRETFNRIGTVNSSISGQTSLAIGVARLSVHLDERQGKLYPSLLRRHL